MKIKDGLYAKIIRDAPIIGSASGNTLYRLAFHIGIRSIAT